LKWIKKILENNRKELFSLKSEGSSIKNNYEMEEEEEMNDHSGPGYGSGATAVCALITNTEIIVANVGDSRCVLSQSKNAIDLSRDHKPELTSERTRIHSAGGFIINGRVGGDLNLCRAIGDLTYKQNHLIPPEQQMITADPELQYHIRSPSDEFLIIACDGVWDVKKSQEAVDYVHKKLSDGLELSKICENLLDDCLAPSSISGLGTDNMTVVIVQLNQVTTHIKDDNDNDNHNHNDNP